MNIFSIYVTHFTNSWKRASSQSKKDKDIGVVIFVIAYLIFMAICSFGAK